MAGVDCHEGPAGEARAGIYRLLPQEIPAGRKAPKGMALQERRSPENKRKVLKRSTGPWVMAKGCSSPHTGVDTMTPAIDVIIRMAYSHVEATGDETKGNPLPFNPLPPTGRPQKPRKRLLRGFLGRFILSGSIYGDADCSVLCHTFSCRLSSS
jgi:hypothetical protein